MNKELQRIKTMYEIFVKKVSNNENEELTYNEKKDFETIEKSLKAFEIIKEKRLAWVWFIDNKLSFEDYNKSLDFLVCEPTHKPKKLTQEEYDLLKEILND